MKSSAKKIILIIGIIVIIAVAIAAPLAVLLTRNDTFDFEKYSSLSQNNTSNNQTNNQTSNQTNNQTNSAMNETTPNKQYSVKPNYARA